MTPRELVSRSVTAFEGGDSSDPNDRAAGAPGVVHTRFGLTWVLFQELRPNLHYQYFLELTRDDVVDILTEWACLAPGFYRIVDPELLEHVVDYAIHSHPRAACKALQWAARVTVDGQFGPQTQAAVNEKDPDQVVLRLACYRLRLWARLFQKDPRQRTYAAGWLNRIAALLEDRAA